MHFSMMCSACFSDCLFRCVSGLEVGKEGRRRRKKGKKERGTPPLSHIPTFHHAPTSTPPLTHTPCPIACWDTPPDQLHVGIHPPAQLHATIHTPRGQTDIVKHCLPTTLFTGGNHGMHCHKLIPKLAIGVFGVHYEPLNNN